MQKGCFAVCGFDIYYFEIFKFWSASVRVYVYRTIITSISMIFFLPINVKLQTNIGILKSTCIGGVE